MLYADRLGPRLGVALAMGWGLGWIAVGRLTDRPESTVVGIAAAIAALVVLAATAAARRRPLPHTRAV